MIQACCFLFQQLLSEYIHQNHLEVGGSVFKIALVPAPGWMQGWDALRLECGNALAP